MLYIFTKSLQGRYYHPHSREKDIGAQRGKGCAWGHTASMKWDQDLNRGHPSPELVFVPLYHIAPPRWPRPISDLCTVSTPGLVARLGLQQTVGRPRETPRCFQRPLPFSEGAVAASLVDRCPGWAEKRREKLAWPDLSKPALSWLSGVCRCTAVRPGKEGRVQGILATSRGKAGRHCGADRVCHA